MKTSYEQIYKLSYYLIKNIKIIKIIFLNNLFKNLFIRLI